MNVIGIICEYNPFHNGHKYHLEKIKEIFPDSLVILVLNGYFLERGEISIISKENKTKLALMNGANLVVELPFAYGSQSADTFANISIKILENLKCDYVVFGSEMNDLEKLYKIYEYINNNEVKYNNDVKKYLSEGYNYATSTSKALYLDEPLKSNDILNLTYLKAIKDNNYHILPYSIKRTSDYLDTISNNEVISATNIRSKLNNKEDISKYVPSITLDYIENIDYDSYFKILKYKIITDEELDKYLDVDEGIENRLKSVINECNNIDELIDKVKTKRYTYNKINRMFIHILVGLTKEDNKNIKLDYIKVLGFNNKGKKYLNEIKKNIHIPITINKDSMIYKYEMKCASIYDLITNKNSIEFENSNKPVNLTKSSF